MLTLPSPAAATPAQDFAVTEEAPGRYELVRVLGRGGQAVVHVAFDHHLGREVAMKVPHLGASSSPVAREQALRRFLREARITALLEHPNIVPIHEIGRRADGSYYCTQRLIRPTASSAEVRTLRSALADAKSLEARIALLPHFIAICNAVAHAHSRGVLHRDLKPENVVIGALGETVVLDWGLARIRGESADATFQDGIVSIAGHAMGTPAYMSPEQARGATTIDERTDVWSLGAILYELLGGAPPFIGGTVAEVVARVQTLPVRPLLEVSAEVPRALAAVAMRALEREPKQRYDSARAVGQEVSAWLVHQPVNAYEYSLLEQLRLLIARNKTASSVVLIALALLAASSALLLRNYWRARSALAEVYVARARSAEDKLQWDAAAAYYAAARVEDDRDEARYGAMLAANRSEVRLRRFSGHAGSVKGLARSADGRQLASAGFDRTIRLWDVASGKTTRVLQGHEAVVTSIALSPDGRWAVSGSEDNTVRLWDLDAGTPGEVILQAASAFNAVAFSADSTAIVAGSENGELTRIAMSDRSLARGPPARLGGVGGHEGPIYSVAFSGDGTQIVSGGWDHKLRFWSGDGGFALHATFRHHTDSLLSVRYSPDGTRFATASRDGTVLLYAVDAGEPIARMVGHEQKVYSVSFSTDGELLASGSTDKSVRVWLAQGSAKLYGGANWRALISSSYGRDHEINAVEFLDEKTLAWAGTGGDIFLRRLGPNRMALEAYFPTDSLVSLPRAKELIFTFAGGFKRERKGDFSALPNIELSKREELSGMGFMGVSVSPDETVLAAGCADDSLCWIGVDPPHDVKRELIPESLQINDTAFSANGRFLAVSTRAGPVFIYDAKARTQLAKLTNHTAGAFSVAFSPDGKLLASGSYDKTVRLWDTATWKQLRVLEGHEHGVRRVAFSPDGKLLASASWDRDARLWDVATGKPVAVLKGHLDQVFALAFSPDGKLLATGGWDGTVRLWNVQTHAQLARYVTEEARLWSVAFSLDGKSLYCAGLWAPHRLDFKPLQPAAEALETALNAGGFVLEEPDLVRAR